jgi:hypothetical protein
MKKLILVFAACSVFAGEMETSIMQLTNLMDQQISKIPKKEVQFDGIQILINSPGVITTIQDNMNLFRWVLLTNYYHDFTASGDESQASLYLSYFPTNSQFASFPAFFGLRYSKPSTLEEYKNIIITAAKTVAGSGYVEISNKASTIYNGIPGWQFSNLGSGYIWFHHILNIQNTSFEIYFMTTPTDFVNSVSIAYYALILSLASFGETTEITAKDNFENLRSPMMLQNYPNPFNSTTVIPYTVSNPSFVKLDILNSNGQKIKTLIDEMKLPGNYEIKWEAINLSNGLYFYRLIEGNKIKTNRMLLVK